ncbi:hypothetical protein [Microcoleus sp. FACHB-672]|uniref:hypothetical protein n=1 Tax=Microcoleus sp. FACHB-672 TaxID=2692825 RepID=UPI001683C0A8|nr:hypothetical protein [Microcoleus sp. FACHB-672]MBD2040306.1 hypothetical protein [Microcoleus sp. FACHB-672]
MIAILTQAEASLLPFWQENQFLQKNSEVFAGSPAVSGFAGTSLTHRGFGPAISPALGCKAQKCG